MRLSSGPMPGRWMQGSLTSARAGVDADVIRSGRWRQRRGSGFSMPTLLIFHEVEDVDHWLTSPKRAELFSKYDVTQIRTFTDPQGSNRVGMILEVPDLSAMPKIMADDEASATMQHDGVRPETVLILQEYSR